MSEDTHGKPILSVDLGGTKILATLISGGTVLERAEVLTDRNSGPEAWLAQINDMTRPWRGQFNQAGIAVTGLVKENFWQSLNPTTLKLPAPFALHAKAEALFGVPITLCNDAQAATWGEYEYGIGQGHDMVFLTISTGVGGGVVTAGKLLIGRGGLAGSFGQVLPLPDISDGRFEDGASGQWIAAEAARLGHESDTRSVFAACAARAEWADALITKSAERVARLCQNLQLMFDPHIIVVGGGIGLAPEYLNKVKHALAHLQPLFRPTLVQGALGRDAGVIGVAALSKRALLKSNMEKQT